MRWGTIRLLLCVALVLVDAKKDPKPKKKPKGKKEQCKNVVAKNEKFPTQEKETGKEY